MGQIGSAAADAVPALATVLSEVDEFTENTMARLFVRIGRTAAETVQALATTFGDDGGLTRRAAAKVLGQIGRTVTKAVTARTATASDDRRSLRHAAAEALVQIAYETPDVAVPALADALTSPHLNVRQIAAEAIIPIGRAAANPSYSGHGRDSAAGVA